MRYENDKRNVNVRGGWTEAPSVGFGCEFLNNNCGKNKKMFFAFFEDENWNFD